MAPTPNLLFWYPPSTPSLRWIAVLPLALSLTACGGDGGSGPGSSGPSEPQVGTVEVSPSTVTLEPGQTAQLTATVRSTTGSPMPGTTISWSSSADTVATVNQTGLVTGVGDGSVTISARAGGRTGQASVEVIPQETLTATPAGGTFSVLDGAVTLDIPAGALTAATEITVLAKEATTGDPYVPGTRFEFGPDGIEFAKSVTLTFAFDTAGIPSGDDAELVRLHRVSAGGPELLLGSRLDLAEGTVSGLVDGFSEFGASPATMQVLLDGIDEMAVALARGDQDLVDVLQEAIHQDVEASFSRLDAQCLASSGTSVKAPLLTQLLHLASIVQGLGFDDLYELTDEPCGGLANPNRTNIEVTPSPVLLGKETQVQLEAKILGPSGEELTGEIEWHSQDPGVASVSTEGQVSGVLHGETMIAVASVDLPFVLGFAVVGVLPDLVVEPTTPELILPMGHDGGLAVTVRDSSRYFDVSTASIEWTIQDQSIVSELGTSTGPPPNLSVRPELLGETTVKACVEGFGPGSCAVVPVRVVYNVEGVWHYHERLTVDLDPPWTETCTVNGQMTVVQSGESYSAYPSETGSCTFDPGDGTDPTVTSIGGEGEITGGRIDGDQFFHLGTFDTSEGTEWCQTRGSLIATGEEGFARQTNGTVACIDSEDWVASGTSHGTWQGLAGVSGAVGPAPGVLIPLWNLSRPGKNQ